MEVRVNLNRTRNFLVAFSLFMAAIGIGFLVGTSYQKKLDLEQCKLAGWQFIEERLLMPDGSKKLEIVRNLQADIATKCITRFE